MYTANTKKALKLCFEAHKNQFDKGGLPYVFHPFHLAEQMKDEACTVTALLHDVVEDTDITLDDLRAMGFGDEVVSAVAVLTHSPDVPYTKYIAGIRANPVARAVKLADLRHNSELTRLDTVTEDDIKRANKYLDAIKLLDA